MSAAHHLTLTKAPSYHSWCSCLRRLRLLGEAPLGGDILSSICLWNPLQLSGSHQPCGKIQAPQAVTKPWMDGLAPKQKIPSSERSVLVTVVCSDWLVTRNHHQEERGQGQGSREGNKPFSQVAYSSILSALRTSAHCEWWCHPGHAERNLRPWVAPKHWQRWKHRGGL